MGTKRSRGPLAALSGFHFPRPAPGNKSGRKTALVIGAVVGAVAHATVPSEEVPLSRPSVRASTCWLRPGLPVGVARGARMPNRGVHDTVVPAFRHAPQRAGRNRSLAA